MAYVDGVRCDRRREEDAGFRHSRRRGNALFVVARIIPLYIMEGSVSSYVCQLVQALTAP